MTIQKFFTSRSKADAPSFVGQAGRLWFDEATVTLYYSDGETPGGLPISGGAGGNPLPSQTGNEGKYLKTDGTTASWASVAGLFSLTVNADTGQVTTNTLGITGGNGITTKISGSNVIIDISNTFELLSKNAKSNPYVINRTGNQITSIVYTLLDSSTITKTFNYSLAKLTSISITGTSLNNLSYTKTLSYTGDVVTSASYSVA